MSAAILTPFALPALDAYWPGEGGRFSGLFGDADGNTRVLILAEPAPAERMRWKRGMEWSKSIDIDGHRDFALPNRPEAWLLCATMRKHFDLSAWYWLRDEYSASDAYYQVFYYGNSYDSDKSDEGRVRACRSFILQSFNSSGGAAA